jgi:hypothetical protein
MTTACHRSAVADPTARPYAQDLDAERDGWYAFVDLTRSLSPEERHRPGYYVDPDWSVRDLVAHVGTWLAEAEIQLERLAAGTYDDVPVDVDVLNARFLEAMGDQAWDVCWVQLNAARTRMLTEWFAQPAANDKAAWWIRKSGSEHYREHLPRLRDWVAELRAGR